MKYLEDISLVKCEDKQGTFGGGGLWMCFWSALGQHVYINLIAETNERMSVICFIANVII